MVRAEMGARAGSFLARGEGPARVVRTFAEMVRSIGRPSGGLLFVSGELTGKLADLKLRLADAVGPLPVLIATGHGVLTERGEVEGETAAAGLLWEGGETETLVVDDEGGTDLGLSLANALERRVTPRTTVFSFIRPRGVLPHTLEPLRSLRCAAIAGAGTATDRGVIALGSSEGGGEPAGAGALLIKGLAPPMMRASPACRLLGPLGRITATRGPMVLEIEGEKALVALSAAASGLTDQPLVFVVLAADAEGEDEPRPLLLRGIQGVDPLRQGLLVSEEVQPGVLMGFAVRDAAAARANFEAATARLARETAGSAPRFGVYVNCAGRGTALYGSADVDVRVIRNRFPDLPFAGISSSFEIAPHGGNPVMQLYTGVLSVFTSPS